MYSLGELQSNFEQKLTRVNFKKEPKILYEPIHYILSNGGKRFRPVLVLLAANLYKDDVEQALDASLAVETFHNFTLMHDDIMDKADMRRGKSTVHKKWDENTAILSGDAMVVMAYQFLQDYEPEILKPLLQIFNQTALMVCEGQQYDMDFESNINVSVDDYLKMIQLKTSVLIAASLQIGAVVTGAPDEDSRALFDFGTNLGIAFQLQDDLLDSFGNEFVFGKKIGGDIVANKKTFLLIKALELAEKNMKDSLVTLITTRHTDKEKKIQDVLEIYQELNIKQITNEMINSYFEKAYFFMDKVALPDERKTELKRFADMVMNRLK